MDSFMEERVSYSDLFPLVQIFPVGSAASTFLPLPQFTSVRTQVPPFQGSPSRTWGQPNQPGGTGAPPLDWAFRVPTPPGHFRPSTGSPHTRDFVKAGPPEG